jgi:hypothetical protein
MYSIMPFSIKLTPDQYNELLIHAIANQRRKDTVKQYTQSDKGKEARKKAAKKYKASEKGKKKIAEINKRYREKVKAKKASQNSGQICLFHK